jgi:hypothetical protein
MMCSDIINLANSCYLDNWANITRVIAYGIFSALFLGTLVGIITSSLRK